MNVNIGGAWRTVASPKVNISGAWRPVQNIWVNVGGVWRQTFANFGLSIVVGAQTTQTIGSSAKRIIHRRSLSATITGQVDPVSYQWSVASTYGATLLANGATATPQISISYSGNPEDNEQSFDSGTVSLTITNGDGKTATASAPYSLG